MSFILNVHDKEHASIERLQRMSIPLGRNILERNRRGKFYDELREFERITRELQSCQILYFFDGSPGETEELRTRRKERLALFRPDEIQTAYDIAVNAALHLGSKDSPQPAFQKGHSTLLQQIAWNHDSLFYKSIPRDFEEMLINLAWFEQLNSLGPRSIAAAPTLMFSEIFNPYVLFNKIFENHFEELNLDHLDKGLAIMERDNAFNHGYTMYNPTLSAGGIALLSRDAMANYALHLNDIYQNIRGDEEKVATLEPIARALSRDLYAKSESGTCYRDMEKYQGLPVVKEFPAVQDRAA